MMGCTHATARHLRVCLAFARAGRAPGQRGTALDVSAGCCGHGPEEQHMDIRRSYICQSLCGEPTETSFVRCTYPAIAPCTERCLGVCICPVLIACESTECCSIQQNLLDRLWEVYGANSQLSQSLPMLSVHL
jgi:hypothetical protein